MTTAQDLIEEARSARMEADEKRAERRVHASRLQQMAASRRAQRIYEELAEHAREREEARTLMYDLVSYVEGSDSAGARRVAGLVTKVTSASQRARRAADPLNITKHTKAKKNDTPPNRMLATVEVKDPGEAVGGTVTVVRNFGESIAGRWFRTNMIDAFELAAAEWFREKYEAAQIGSIRAQDLEKPITDGGLPISSMSDAALVAAQKLAEISDRIRRHAGDRAYSVLEELVGQGKPLKEVVPRHTNLLYRLGDGYVIGLTKEALDAIVEFKGMRPRAEAPQEEQSDGRGKVVKAPKIRATNEPGSVPVEYSPNRFGDMVESNRSRLLRMESDERKKKAAGAMNVPAR